MVEVANTKWAESGRRLDLEVDVYADGFFSRGEKEYSFKMFALGGVDVMNKIEGQELKLAELVAEKKKSWLGNSGKRFYYLNGVMPGINVRIEKSKYQVYES